MARHVHPTAGVGAEPKTRRNRKSRRAESGPVNLPQNVGGRDRVARALLAAVLTLGTVQLLRSGRRRLGLLAVLGAVGLGFNAVTCFCGVNETLGIDTTEGKG